MIERETPEPAFRRRLSGRLMFGLALAIALVLALTLAGVAQASCGYYTGPPGGSWQQPENWSGDAVPTATEVICIPEEKGPVVVTGTATARILLAVGAIRVEPGATLAIAGAEGETSSFGELFVGGTLTTAASSLALFGDTTVEGEIARTAATGGLDVERGTLSGDGTIALPLNLDGGKVAPGTRGTIGTLNLDSSLSMTPTSSIAIDVASAGSFDRLRMNGGNASVEGSVKATLLDGYHPAVGSTWDFLEGASTSNSTGATATPANFAVQAVGGLVQLELVTALPEEPAPSSPPSGTPPSAGAGPSAAEVAAAEARAALLADCSTSKLAIDDLYIQGKQLEVLGSAPGLAGQKVEIEQGRHRLPGTATVAQDGLFSFHATLSAAARRNTHATYTVTAAGVSSASVSPGRRLQLTAPAVKGGRVTLAGHVTAPLAGRSAPLVVEEQVSCGQVTVVKRVHPGRTGGFQVSFAAPTGASAAVYRISTLVASKPHGRPRLAVRSLAVPVDLG